MEMIALVLQHSGMETLGLQGQWLPPTVERLKLHLLAAQYLST